MLFLSILQHYLTWHYTTGLTELWHIAKNFLWFITNFFSLAQLGKSLLAPFRRITEDRGETFNFEDLASYIIVNLISRLIGLFLRLVIILTGLACLVILSTLTLVTYVIWLSAPVFIIACIAYGLYLIVSSL